VADYSTVVERLYERQRFGIKLGLANITALLARLGDPHNKFPSVLIAGTNGKGSTAAFTRSVLEAAGYQVGLYTSPHLESFRERIQVGSACIAEDDVVALSDQIEEVLRCSPASLAEPSGDLTHVTFFEFVTAMALRYFADRQVDIAVLEVGMGGRLDATNVVTPLVSVITGVELDHCAQLGSTISSIAREKAGIIKPQGLVVTPALQNGALDVIAEVSRARDATLFVGARDFWWRRTSFSRQGQTFRYGDDAGELCDLAITLLGAHQVANAAVAVRTCRLLRAYGYRVGQDALRHGLGEARWPGRFEVVRDNPTVVLDSAHNPDGARKLRAALEEVFPGRRVILVFGVMEDKDAASMMEALQPVVDCAVVTRPHLDRAAGVRALAELAAKFFGRVEAVEEVVDAVAFAVGIAGAEDVVCVTGSIFTVAEARTALVT